MSFRSLAKHIVFLSILMRVDISQGHYTVYTHCDDEVPCLTLSIVAANISSYFDANTTLTFQEGTHYLDCEISVTGVATEILLQTNSETLESAIIICRNNARLIFTNINQLRISRLNFIDCSVTVKVVEHFILENSSFNGHNVNSSAIIFNQANAEILGSSFVANSIGTFKGSVQFLDEVDHPYSLVHVLSHNARLGGALVVTNSNLSIIDSHFANNSAQLGGAIFVEVGSTMIINDGTFVGNSADNCMDDCCNGGAIFIDSSCTVTAHNSTFDNNTSEFSGGAIALFKGAFKGIQNEFTSNGARNFGGSIFAHFNSSINSDMSTFTHSEAGFSGGVMYADYLSSIIVKNGTFLHNAATMTTCTTDNSIAMNLGGTCFDSEGGFGGGALYARYGSTIVIEDSNFSGNKAENDGGVMYAMSNSTITVEDSTFDSNSARYGGGVMYSYYYSSVTVHNSQFSNSEAGNAGGVFHVFYSSKLSLVNTTFDCNKAGYIGGVLHAFYLSTVTIDGSLFSNNKAGYFGGVLYANYLCNTAVYSSSFNNNSVNADGGVIFAYDNNTIVVHSSYFDNNTADGNGGAVYASHLSCIMLRNECVLSHNSAQMSGGAVFIRDHASFTDLGSDYMENTAEINGGSICIFSESDIKLKGSTFIGNSARELGGALHMKGIVHRAIIEGNTFVGNMAMSGGAIAMSTADSLNMSDNALVSNYATDKGGALYLTRGYNLTSDCDNFINNSAGQDGGVFYLQGQNRLTVQDGNFSSNRATYSGGVIFSLINTTLRMSGENCSFLRNQAGNGGVIYAYYCRVEIYAQYVSMVNNIANDSGGALHLSGSHLTSSSNTISLVSENQANNGNGGAVYATYSNLQMSNLLKVRNNSASVCGGGMYLKSTKLQVNGNYTYFANNTANISGGGLHASNSSIMVNGTVHFFNNRADNGGGISFEGNDRLRGLSTTNDSLNFLSNIAKYHGGALYVNDSSNTEFCSVSKDATVTECFFSSIFFNFEGNFAGISGTDLFGGFLDRCTPKQRSLPEDVDVPRGLRSLRESSNIESYDTISSLPVQVCFCINGVRNCTYRPDFIQVETERSFSVEIIALDQVTHGVNATFDCSLTSSSSSLRQDETIQHASKNCTKLNFSSELFITLGLENLFLSVRGPCNVTEMPNRNVSISVTCSCPLGFQNSNNVTCECVCHEVLRPYNAECDLKTRSIIRNDNFWITYIESTEDYLIYPNCPFDYCHPKQPNVTVDLNTPNGSDAQCASNRVGTLCGACQPGLSVSLGSSQCLSCPTYWSWLVAAIAIAFILAGIALVCLLLVLNLTVAVGTLNAIIFYANIVAANRSVIFQTSEISFATVFISWLNFDIGFDTCFYNGMDTYVKTWLQLAFPLYIIFLVVLIMKLSHYSDRFGHLIGRKDPVATLATLILLSYTKFLQIIITVFSIAVLEYSDGSREYVWLPDATIEYIASKHILLFVTAISILLVGLTYTFLLFSYQWLLCCPRKRVKWIRNQKVNYFMDMYAIPYTPTHRYWTGLLLLVRVSIYLVSAFNPSSDPRVTLSSTIFILSFLFLYIAIFNVRMYKHCLVNSMEILTYFNLIALSIFTWYTTDAGGNQEVVTNISIGITFVQLLAVLLCHVFRYCNQNLYSKFVKNVDIIKLNNFFEQMKCSRGSSSNHGNDNAHQVYEILDMVDRQSNKIDKQGLSNVTTTTSSTVVDMATSDFVEEDFEFNSEPNDVNETISQ